MKYIKILVWALAMFGWGYTAGKSFQLMWEVAPVQFTIVVSCLFYTAASISADVWRDVQK